MIIYVCTYAIGDDCPGYMMIRVHVDVDVMLVDSAKSRHREVNLVRLLQAGMRREMLNLPQGSDAEVIAGAALRAVEATLVVPTTAPSEAVVSASACFTQPS